MATIHRTLLFVSSVIVLSLLIFPVFAQVAPIIAPNCGFPGMNCTGAETFGGTVQPWVLNLINIIVGLMATLSVAYLVVAGIQYVTSQGDTEKATKAKSQALYALLGLVLATGALIIVNAVIAINPVLITGFVTPYINAAITLMGTLSTIFLIYAGIQYVTSQGDTEKATKAKSQVLYAILGLILAISAWVIVNAVVVINPALISALALPYINMTLSLIGLVAVIYIIYAGVKYISSNGDEEAVATAKRQILFALLGIFIAGTAQIIVNVVQIQDATLLIASIRNVVNSVLTIVSVAAAIYVIVGGVMYLSSQGDPDKATRAKMQVLYAILGVIVVALSAILVNYIINNL